MKNISKKAKRLLAVALALVMVMGACFTGVITASAESVDVTTLSDNVDNLATVSEFSARCTNAVNGITEGSTVTETDAGVHYEVNRYSAIVPAELTTSLGTWGNGFKLQFANYDRLSTNGDYYGQFLITLSTLNQSSGNYMFWRVVADSFSGCVGINIDTNTGELQLVKSYNTNTYQTIVLAQNAALLYDNFKEKAFSVEFKPNGTGANNMDVVVDVEGTKVVGLLDYATMSAPIVYTVDDVEKTRNMRYPNPNQNTYVSFGAIRNDSWSGCSVDFIGYTLGAIPTYADGTVEHVVTPSDNCLTASRDLVTGGTKYFATDLTYGTHIDVTPWGQAGWYPYCLGDNLGAFPSNGLALQFANFKLADPANNASFLVAFSPDRATAYNFNNQKFCYWDSTYQRPGIAIDTAKGEVQLVKSLGVPVEGKTDRGDWEISSVLIQDEAFLYENFTDKSFRFEFTPSGNNGINLKVIVADEAFTAEIPMSDFTSAPAGQKSGGTYIYPTSNTYIDIGTCERFGSTVVDFIGYSTGLTPAYADGTVETYVTAVDDNSLYSIVPNVYSKSFAVDLNYGGIHIDSANGTGGQSGWYPYALNHNFGAFTKGMKLQFANYASNNPATGKLVVAFGGACLNNSASLSGRRFASNQASIQRPAIAIDTVAGEVQLVKSSGVLLDPENVNSGSAIEVTKTIISDSAFLYSNFTGKAFRIELQQDGNAGMEVKVIVGNQTFTGNFTLAEFNAAPATLKSGGYYEPPTTSTYIDIGTTTRFGHYSVDFIGYSAGDVPAYYATSVENHASKATNARSSSDNYMTNVGDYAVNINLTTQAGWYPYVYDQNLGAFPGNGIALQFANFTSDQDARSAFVVALGTVGAHGSDALLDQFRFASDYAYYQRPGIAINTIEGKVQLIKSNGNKLDPNDVNSGSDYEVTKTLITDDAFKYANFTGKAFRFEFKNAYRETGEIRLDVTVGNQTFTGYFTQAEFTAAPANLKAGGTYRYPTTATYVDIGSANRFGVINVDFIGSTVGLETDIAAGTENVDGSVTYASGFVRPDDKNIRILGHWAQSETELKGYFENGIELKFTGTRIGLDFTGDITASVDNGPWEIYRGGAYTVLASNLAAGEHKVRINANFQGATPVIKSFVIEENASTLPADNNKVISFIGDSITEGYFGGAAGLVNSFGNAYGPQVADNLGFAVTGTAYGGIAIIDNDEHATADELGMPSRYWKLGEKGSDAADVAFDTTNFQPEYIVVALGTNGTNGGSAVQTAYENFLVSLRENYPNSKIFCVTPFLNKNVTEIQNAYNNRVAAGDNNIHFINASGWNPSTEGVADGVHPNYEGQTQIATKLTAAIQSILEAEALQDVMDAVTANTMDSSDIRVMTTAGSYAQGTLGFSTSIGAMAEELPANVQVLGYGTVFMRDALRTANGKAYAAGTNDYVGELTVGYTNTINNVTYNSVTAYKALQDNETLPEMFIAVLKDYGAAANGQVSYGYYKTKYAARSYIKCYDETRGIEFCIYADTVVTSAYMINSSLPITNS